MKKIIWDWAERVASRPSAEKWLYALSFAESSFFPVPTDFVLMPVVAKRSGRWLTIALWTGVFSVIGGILGYIVGAGLFEVVGKPLVGLYKLEEQVVSIGRAFNNNAFIAIVTAAFTPIPYKAFTIAAGLFRIDIITFVIASFIGRFTRFFIVAYIMKRYGARVGETLFRHFNSITVVCAALAAGYLLGRIIL